MSSDHDSRASQEAEHVRAPADAATPATDTPATVPLAPALALRLAGTDGGGRGNGPVRQAALLQMQQTRGNRAMQRLLQRKVSGGAVVVQRSPADTAAAQLEEKPKAKSIAVVKAYKKNSKKTDVTTWKRVLTAVKAEEDYWAGIRDHVMLGENAQPPKGFHSKLHQGDAHAVVVGPKNPPNAPGRSPYKQWIRKRGDTGFGHLKISTFYPDNWSEDKIQAAVLLRNAGAGHEAEATFDLTANDGTVYPDTALENPTKPTA